MYTYYNEGGEKSEMMFTAGEIFGLSYLKINSAVNVTESVGQGKRRYGNTVIDRGMSYFFLCVLPTR